MMETPDFLVQDDVYDNSVYPNDERQMASRTVRTESTESRDEYEEYGTIIFDSGEPGKIHIKVEQLGDNATDDENVAVEALRSLSGVRPQQMIHLCPNCNTFKPTLQEYEEHVVVCQKSTLHPCPICKETFEKMSELNNHLVCHASSRPHACRLCGSLFLLKQDLLNHLTKKHRVRQSHVCKTCGQMFTRMSGLTNHQKIHTYTAGRAMIDKIGDTNELEDILTGNADPELNTTRQKLVLPSINQMTGNSSAWGMNYESDAYNGMNLSDINPNIPNLNDNITTGLTSNSVPTSGDDATSTLATSTSKDRPYKCDKCSKSFSREKAYVNHMSNLNNHFACDWCYQHFPSHKSLECHKRYCGNNGTNDKSKKKTKRNTKNGYGGDELKHVCDVCDKQFSTKQKLFRHKWIHRSRMHICEVCSEGFNLEKSLNAHRLRKHPPEGPYICTECGKNFVSRQGLWEHGKTHAKDTNYFQCEECEKTFASRQGFLIHKRTHTDERPYGCKYCLKSFRDGGTLRKHERIHTGERPHACPVCSKAFNQKVVLREHVRGIHANTAIENEEGLFACQLCECCFMEKDELSAHYMTHSDRLARIAKEASKNNILKQSPEKNNTTASTSVISCDVELDIQEEVVESFAVNKMATYFEMTRVPTDGGNGAYEPKIKVNELLRSPEVKLEQIDFETVELQCDLCGTCFDNKEDLSRHVSVHILQDKYASEAVTL